MGERKKPHLVIRHGKGGGKINWIAEKGGGGFYNISGRERPNFLYQRNKKRKRESSLHSRGGKKGFSNPEQH